MKIEREVTTSAPPDQVFAYLSDFTTTTEWDPGTVHGPWRTRIAFEIRSVDAAARVWSWRVGVGPLGLVMDHGVEETGTGARAWVRLHAPAPLVAPYAPIARLALRRLVS